VKGCDSGAYDSEPNAGRGQWRPVEKYPDEEARSDDGAGNDDIKGWTCLQQKEGGSNGEWEDKAACNLIEGRINIFERIVAGTERRKARSVGSEHCL
jgi:hypothetical protein